MSVLAEVTYTNRVETRDIINEVVKEARDSVCATMGPNGSQVVINQMNIPTVTKDGVSVAKALDFGEPRRNMIAMIIREPSMRVDNEVGDGTTTTVFMTSKLYEAFRDNMSFQEVRFINTLVERSLEILRERIIPVTVDSPEFKMMLNTTSNYETEIVDRILEIYHSYDTPQITLKRNSNLPADVIDLQTNIQYDGRYATQFFSRFAMNPEQDIQWNAGTPVIIIDGQIEKMLLEDMAAIAPPGGKNVVVIAKSWSIAAGQHIESYMQQTKGAPLIMAYTMEASGTLGSETMKDLADLLNIPTFIEMEYGAKQSPTTDVSFITGQKGIRLSKEDPVIQVRADVIANRLDEIFELLTQGARQTPSGLNLYRRIGILRANNVIVTVTGETVSDCNERYYRYEDVMKAASTAVNFGVLPGIGWGYLTAASAIETEYQAKELTNNQQYLLDTFLAVMRSQYEYLTGYNYKELMTPASGFWIFKKPAGKLKFLDLTSGEVSDHPGKVFDNAAATCLALSAGWSTAKTLGKLVTIQGRGDKNYLNIK